MAGSPAAASKPVAVGRVVRGKYSLPEPFDVAWTTAAWWNAGRAIKHIDTGRPIETQVCPVP
jgi:hypothetical protein